MNRFLVALTLSVAVLSAAPLKIDSPLSTLESFKYETPQGRQMKIPNKTKLVILLMSI